MGTLTLTLNDAPSIDLAELIVSDAGPDTQAVIDATFRDLDRLAETLLAEGGPCLEVGAIEVVSDDGLPTALDFDLRTLQTIDLPGWFAGALERALGQISGIAHRYSAGAVVRRNISAPFRQAELEGFYL